ncbi:hypothetical protein L596_018771 [Steinernema carpocapsae]|uniref:MYND-type domain-containing protein n=1 Tax=Steinernema carpocapsae TaxID=34508 RepID=A0A4U5N6D3_STECR|nr:hypothetical protein L596_018771 [Steinernema carpocapsae]
MSPRSPTKREKQFISVQQEWSTAFKMSLEKAMTELTERLHQEYLSDRQRMEKEIQNEYRRREEETKSIVFKEMEGELDRRIKELQAQHVLDLNQTKRKQWCRVCGNLSSYPCCWNVSYCSKECQHRNWREHRPSCRRKKEEQENRVKQEGSPEEATAD